MRVLNKKSRKYGVIITAAGKSRRMGCDKALIETAKGTFIECIIHAFLEADARFSIVVITGQNSEILQNLLSGKNLSFLQNKRGMDQLYSIKLGLQKIIESDVNLEGIFICPVDNPNVSFELVNALVGEWERNSSNVLVPVYKGQGGHPVIIHSDLCKSIIDFNGNGGLRSFFRSITSVHRIELGYAEILTNMNKPDDLDTLHTPQSDRI